MALGQLPAAKESSGAGTVFQRKLVGVLTRENWGDAWVRRPFLEAVGDVSAAAPSIGQATFRYRYGSIAREGSHVFERYEPFDLSGHWVRVIDLVTGAAEWTGRFAEDAREPYANTTGAGWQDFTAYSLFHELDRDEISWAQAACNGVSSTIEHSPAFNHRAIPKMKFSTGAEARGNRSAARNADGVYEFSADSELWTNRQAAEYVLQYHTPASGPRFVLGGQVDVLDKLHSIVEMEGRTPWSVLCELIDRRRGLGFYEQYIESAADSYVVLYVYTTLDSALTVGGVQIPENARQIVYNVNSRIEYQNVKIRNSTAIRYDRFVVRGNRILSCFTLGYRDATLTEKWTAARLAAYKSGGAGSYPDYSNASVYTDADRANINDTIRQHDHLQEVFSKHGLPAAWDGKTGDGQGGGLSVALPVCTELGEVLSDVPHAFFPLEKHFESALPFEEGMDYSVYPFAGTGQPSGAEPAYQKPFAVVEDTDGDWHLTDRPGPDYQQGSAHLSVSPREAALAVSSSPRHAYALNHWTSAEPWNDDPVFDYQKIACTVAMRTDQVIQVSSTRADLDNNAEIRRKIIQVDDAELWWVTPGTIVGVGPDLEPVYYAGPSILRDDRPRLWEVAAAAEAWYSSERRAVEIPAKFRFDSVPLGSLLQTVYSGEDEIQVNSVVTCKRRNWQQQTQTIETSWFELDWSASDE